MRFLQENKILIGYKARQNWQTHLQEAMSNLKGGKLWIHCASLGEFEQGRPLIERIKHEMPHLKIILTFFSPSGYEVRKNFPFADWVGYMPYDTPANARNFVEIVRPVAAIFVKYEFWLNHLAALSKKNIPHYVVSAIFRPDNVFFAWYGGIFRHALRQFSHIFVQDHASAKLLEKININQVTVAPDTRFDRVLATREHATMLPVIAQFAQQHRLCIAGSTWPADEHDILLPYINNITQADLKFVIAPHEITPSHLSSLENALKLPYLRYSQAAQATAQQLHAAKVLLIDNIGMLSSCYQYGHFAYIGGGFGKGIHNILEAAVFGLPIIFGTRYQKFAEAHDLIELGGAFSVTNQQDFRTLADRLLASSSFWQNAATASKQYVDNRAGGTDIIWKHIADECLLPKK